MAENTAFNKNFETSTGNIKADSSVSVGASGKIPHSDHVHPKFTVQEADISLSAGSAVDNANLTTHGFLDILPGGTTVFKRGDGAWASPASGSAQRPQTPW